MIFTYSSGHTIDVPVGEAVRGLRHKGGRPIKLELTGREAISCTEEYFFATLKFVGCRPNYSIYVAGDKVYGG